jgi:hypothetical protein
MALSMRQASGTVEFRKGFQNMLSNLCFASRLAVSLLGKSKDDLIEAMCALDNDQKTDLFVGKTLAAASDHARKLHQFIAAAEIRVMSAAARVPS